MLPQVLLVEDNPGDVGLIREALRDNDIRLDLHIVNDGIEAIAFLLHEGRHSEAPRPNLILLDLNLPRLDGRELLQRIKTDPDLAPIPVVVMTTSSADEDVHRSYSLQGNCYVTKPIHLDDFLRTVRSVERFWLRVARLPD